MCGWSAVSTGAYTDAWISGARTDGQMNGPTEKWKVGRTDGWKDGRTEGRKDGWMESREDGHTNRDNEEQMAFAPKVDGWVYTHTNGYSER